MNMNATLIGHVIWFAVFVWLTMKYIWPPIQKAMADREKQSLEPHSRTEDMVGGLLSTTLLLVVEVPVDL